MDVFWNILFAGLGVVIAGLQVRLSKQINEQNMAKERGYFIVEETNLSKRENDDYHKYIGIFNIKAPIHFNIHGNGDIFLLQQLISVNGNIVDRKEQLETFFPNSNEYAKFGILLPLKEKDKEQKRIDVDITLKMKNIMGYTYTEVVSLQFEKDDDNSLWFLKKRNTMFTK